MKENLKDKDLAFVISSSKLELFLEESKNNCSRKSLNRIESRLKKINQKKK